MLLWFHIIYICPDQTVSFRINCKIFQNIAILSIKTTCLSEFIISVTMMYKNWSMIYVCSLLLTLCGLVTYMAPYTIVSIGSCNGLSLLPVMRQAIAWTNADLLAAPPLGTNFLEIGINALPLRNCTKSVVLKCQPFYSVPSVWTYCTVKSLNISRTKSQNLNDSHFVLKSSLPNPLKPGVKSRMKM